MSLCLTRASEEKQTVLVPTDYCFLVSVLFSLESNNPEVGTLGHILVTAMKREGKEVLFLMKFCPVGRYLSSFNMTNKLFTPGLDNNILMPGGYIPRLYWSSSHLKTKHQDQSLKHLIELHLSPRKNIIGEDCK